MNTESRNLALGLDGLWTPMDFARLMHLVVRFYRLEQLVRMAEGGGRNLFEDRLDAVALKYLAAFDWIAAPLMSAKYNQSFAQSEDFVQKFDLADLQVVRLTYGEGGEAVFRGEAGIVARLHAVLREIFEMHQHGSPIADDSQGKYSALEAMYAQNLKAKAQLMAGASYSEAELNALISPSIEDLHFLSNAMRQGRIVTVGKRAA